MAKLQPKKMVFESWGDFVTLAETRPNNPYANNSRKVGGDGYFDIDRGTRTFEDALKLAREGWPEGSAKVAALADAMVNRISAKIERQDLYFDVEGADYDMGLYLKGEPECWNRWQTEISEGQGTRIFKLIYNISASGSVSGETITAKGAAVAALIQCLEYAGNRVELWIASGTCEHYSYERDGSENNQPATLETYTLLKPADQPCDMDRIAFALAHPATLRRLNFAVRESWVEFMAEVRDSYGYSCDVAERGDIYIAKSFAGEPYWSSPESAQAWIMAELEKQGVKISKSE